MVSKLSGEQRLLCGLLSAALNGNRLSEKDRRSLAADADKILQMAERHSVLPLLYDVLCELHLFEDYMRSRLKPLAEKTVRQSYRLLFLTKYLVRLLEDEQIPVAVLKGCGVAACYPVPELRKSGDVDLLVQRSNLNRARYVLERSGYRALEKQTANHHLVFRSGEGIDVELHVLLAEPFDDEQMNERMREMADQFAAKIIRRPCMGIDFPVLADAYQAFQLLLHMLQHFLRAGFGLKLLCDWTVFWNRQMKEDVWPEFEQLVRLNGIYDFAMVVTECCAEYLGLRPEYAKGGHNREWAERFLCDVFEAEEFGRSSAERMVAVQGTGIRAYIKEFHHQMKLNHPKLARHAVFWPFLWLVTLAVFLRNNRRLNRGSMTLIMKKAGDRGRLVRQLRLWEKRDEGHEGD